MLQENDIQRANRENGNWVPGGEGCVDHLQPCGNPRCLDLAMAAGELDGKGYAEDAEAGRLLTEAAVVARQCSQRTATCPLLPNAAATLYRFFYKHIQS